MNFVTRTRVVQYADLVGGVQIDLDTPIVAKTFAVGIIYQKIVDANNALPVNQQVDPSNFWKYILEYEIHYHAVPTILGVVAGMPLTVSRLVFDVDFWDNMTDRVNGNPPLRRNRHIHDFTSKQLAGSGQIIVNEIDEFVMRAEFLNFPIDSRDPVTTTKNPTEDHLNILTRPAVTNKDGVPIDIQPHWKIY